MQVRMQGAVHALTRLGAGSGGPTGMKNSAPPRVSIKSYQTGRKVYKSHQFISIVLFSIEI